MFNASLTTTFSVFIVQCARKLRRVPKMFDFNFLNLCLSSYVYVRIKRLYDYNSNYQESNDRVKHKPSGL